MAFSAPRNRAVVFGVTKRTASVRAQRHETGPSFGHVRFEVGVVRGERADFDEIELERAAGEIRGACATLRLNDSLRRLPTRTATWRAVVISRSAVSFAAHQSTSV
jgi:hypothetical protein